MTAQAVVERAAVEKEVGCHFWVRDFERRYRTGVSGDALRAPLEAARRVREPCTYANICMHAG